MSLYFTIAGAAMLAFDFCLNKTIRLVLNSHALYEETFAKYHMDLKNLMFPLQIDFKLTLTAALLTEYDGNKMRNDEILRPILTHIQSTTELIEIECQRLKSLSETVRLSRLRQWFAQPQWNKEIIFLTQLIGNLDLQIQTLLLFRK